MITFNDGRASPELRRLQQTQKKLAERFFQYCLSHDLYPFLVAGSALGAARHQDMIPWDDDIDVGLLREDFDRLLRTYDDRPIDGLFLQSWKTEPGYPFAHAKLRIDGTHFSEAAFNGMHFHQGIFIDIFPFDRVPKLRLKRLIQAGLINLLSVILLTFNTSIVQMMTSRPKQFAGRIVLFVRPVLPLSKLVRLRDWVSKWGNADEPDGKIEAISFQMCGIAKDQRTRVPLKVLLPPVEMDFGEIVAPVPANIDEYLRSFFGRWRELPPTELRKPAHTSLVDFGD